MPTTQGQGCFQIRMLGSSRGLVPRVQHLCSPAVSFSYTVTLKLMSGLEEPFKDLLPGLPSARSQPNHHPHSLCSEPHVAR